LVRAGPGPGRPGPGPGQGRAGPGRAGTGQGQGQGRGQGQGPGPGPGQGQGPGPGSETGTRDGDTDGSRDRVRSQGTGTGTGPRSGAKDREPGDRETGDGVRRTESRDPEYPGPGTRDHGSRVQRPEDRGPGTTGDKGSRATGDRGHGGKREHGHRVKRTREKGTQGNPRPQSLGDQGLSSNSKQRGDKEHQAGKLAQSEQRRYRVNPQKEKKRSRPGERRNKQPYTETPAENGHSIRDRIRKAARRKAIHTETNLRIYREVTDYDWRAVRRRTHNRTYYNVAEKHGTNAAREVLVHRSTQRSRRVTKERELQHARGASNAQEGKAANKRKTKTEPRKTTTEGRTGDPKRKRRAHTSEKTHESQKGADDIARRKVSKRQTLDH